MTQNKMDSNDLFSITSKLIDIKHAIQSKHSSGFYIVWWIGFLFTTGYIPIDSNIGLSAALLKSFELFILWPYILGQNLR